MRLPCVRTRGQGRHLAIAREQQAATSDGCANPGEHRHVQRVVRGIAGMNLGGDELAGRLRRSGHEFDLGQIGPVVLAVAALHDAIRSDDVIATGGRAVQTDTVSRYLVDFAGCLPESGFECCPVGVVEPPQDDRVHSQKVLNRHLGQEYTDQALTATHPCGADSLNPE